MITKQEINRRLQLTEKTGMCESATPDMWAFVFPSESKMHEWVRVCCKVFGEDRVRTSNNRSVKRVNGEIVFGGPVYRGYIHFG